MFAAGGWIGQLGSLAFIVLAAPVISIETAAGTVWLFGALGVVFAPLGELFQWSARHELEDRGEPVPEAWQPEEGNRLDRAVVAVLTFPLGEWLADRYQEVSEVWSGDAAVISCQFPGCENDASATYCSECQGAVRGQRPGTIYKLRRFGALAYWSFIFCLMWACLKIAGSIQRTIGRW